MNNSTDITLPELNNSTFYCFMAGYIFCGFVQIVGIALMVYAKIEAVNQKLAIIGLAAAEFLSCMDQILFHIGFLNDFDSLNWWVAFGTFLQTFTALVTKCMMFVIIIDRFLYIYLSLKYHVCTQTKVLCGITSIWTLCAIVSGGLGLAGKYIKDENTIHTIYNTFYCVYFTLDVIITITAITVYAYFYWKVHLVKLRERTIVRALKQMHSPPQRTTRFLVPCLIVLNFIIFNMSATLILMITRNTMSLGEKSIKLSQIAFLLLLLGWLSDAGIFIFFQKEVRNVWKGMMTKRRRFTTRVSPIGLVSAEALKETILS